MRQIANKTYMESKDLAAYIGLSHETVKYYHKNKAQRHRLPHESLVLGGRPYWLQADVDNWLKAMEVKV